MKQSTNSLKLVKLCIIITFGEIAPVSCSTDDKVIKEQVPMGGPQTIKHL